MTLVPYDLTFKHPIYIHALKQGEAKDYKLESKNGLLLKLERDNITSISDVSPLEHLNTESYKDVHIDCKNINTNQIFSDIDIHLKKDSDKLFREEKFLDFDFSKYTSHPSLQHALSCLFSEYYRKKLGIKIEGKTFFHGLIPNSLTKEPGDVSLKKAILFEKSGFRVAKIKIGNSLNQGDIEKDNSLIKSILSATSHLKLRLDANRKFSIHDFKVILKNIDLARIDYIEEPVKKPSELVDFNLEVGVGIALDENIKLLKDIHFSGVKSVILKPTVVGDYHALKKIILTCKKRNISPVFSSSFESQVGIYQIAQLANAVNSREYHGLDTYDCFLENLMDLNIIQDAIILKNEAEAKGPLYV